MQRLPLLLMIAFTLVAGTMARACAEQDGSPVRASHGKSGQEVADYSANYSLNGGAPQEQAAIAFAQKYPESELRESLFARAMQAYQRENSPDGILKMGERVLALDPNHSLALVLTAPVLADSLVSGAPDHDKQVPEIKKKTPRPIQPIHT